MAVGVRVGPSVGVGLVFAVGTAVGVGVLPLSNKSHRHRVGTLLSIGFGFLLAARRWIMQMLDVRATANDIGLAVWLRVPPQTTESVPGVANRSQFPVL